MDHIRTGHEESVNNYSASGKSVVLGCCKYEEVNHGWLTVRCPAVQLKLDQKALTQENHSWVHSVFLTKAHCVLVSCLKKCWIYFLPPHLHSQCLSIMSCAIYSKHAFFFYCSAVELLLGYSELPTVNEQERDIPYTGRSMQLSTCFSGSCTCTK